MINKDLTAKDVQEYLAELTLNLIGDRWKVQIIRNLMEGTKRFGELRRDLGSITQKVLTSNLRFLEEKGILIRNVYAQIPPKVEYTLTNIGYSLRPVLDTLAQWGAEYKQTVTVSFSKI